MPHGHVSIADLVSHDFFHACLYASNFHLKPTLIGKISSKHKKMIFFGPVQALVCFGTLKTTPPGSVKVKTTKNTPLYRFLTPRCYGLVANGRHWLPLAVKTRFFSKTLKKWPSYKKTQKNWPGRSKNT